MGASVYERAIDALGRALVFGIHPSLDGIRELTEELGRPQELFVCIQIAGTNGKTSTARLTEAIVRSEGRKTGLYTSPHLERYPERIEVDGHVVSDEDFGRAVHAAIEAGERRRPGTFGTEGGFTEFELLTAAALWLFRELGVDVAVLEVGLGGRWDATSVVTPKVAVITGIGLDHTHILGDSLEKIAAEKAGIIKGGAVVVLGPGTSGLEHVFETRAAEQHSQVLAVQNAEERPPSSRESSVTFSAYRCGEETCVDVQAVLGSYARLQLGTPLYQAANVATAVATAEQVLGRALEPDHLRQALLGVRIPGRFETVSTDPLVIVDGSHNPQAASVLAGAVAEVFSGVRLHVLLGVLSDKDAQGIVEAIAPVAETISVTSPRAERALPAHDLASIVLGVCGYEPLVFDSVEAALVGLLPHHAPLLVTGSLTTAGEARGLLRNASATST